MRGQKGFAILELMIAAIILTLLAVWASNTLVNRINDASAQASAAWMLAVNKSVHGYIRRHAGAMAQAQHSGALQPEGYADWSAPELFELKADGLLSRGFPESVSRGGGVSIRLIRDGVCPGPTCRLEALMYSKQPLLLSRGRVDEQMVAQWILAAQGWGGSVTQAQPQLVRGAAFEMPNPPAPGAALPPGTVALAITSEQLSHLDFLRVGDLRDPDFQGTASVKGDISTQGGLRAQQYLHLGAQERLHGPCKDSTAVARGADGGLLVCSGKIWRPSSRTGSGGYSINLRYGCKTRSDASTENPVTGACSCPGLSTPVLIADSGPLEFPEGRTMGYLCVD